MAGETRHRIEFENNVIQEQAIWQMLPKILSKKRSKEHPLTEKEHHQIPELELLWEKCTDPSSVICLAAVGVFVELVSQNVADFGYVMNGFLNRVPSSRNFLGPIHGITQLLCLQMKHGPNSSPYSLRSTPHPYIAVLANSSAWPIMVQEIQNLFGNYQDRSLMLIFKMFDPFFKYVLFNPKPNFTMCRDLHLLLMNVATELSSGHQEILNDILDLVTNHISLFQKNMTSLGHSVSLCQETLHWLLKKDEALFEKYFKTLTILLLEMCHEQLLIGIPLMSSLVLLNKVTKVKPWAVVTSGTVFALSHFLLKCSEYYLQELVNIASNICTYIITSCPNDTVKLSVFVLPLLQILARSNISTIKKATIRSHSAKLLSKVEETLEAEYSESNFQEERKVEASPLPGNRLRKMSVYEKMFQFVLSSRDSTLLKWLESLETSFSDLAAKRDLSYVSLLLSSLLVKCSECAGPRVLDVIAAVSKADPTQAPYFLPLVLFKMERCSSADLKLHILQTIPKLATHKICVKQVLGTLLVLNNNTDLKAITLRLMFKLWLLQPRVYSHLEKLIKEKTLSLSREARMELDLARAVTIRDICREKPTQHGEDFVVSISEIINENALSGSVVLVCLAVEALQALASAQVVDLGSTWDVIKPKLERNHHPFVIRSLCDLFSVAPSVAVDSEEYEQFKACALTFLWKNALQENDVVSGAAFNALSKFDTKDFLLKYLPHKDCQSVIAGLKNTPKIKRMMREKEKEEEDEEEIDFGSFALPGFFYIDLLQQVSIPIHPAYKEFLKRAVQQEISELPRGLSHKVMKPKQAVGNETMASIPVLLQTQYDKCKQPSLKPTIAASLLFSYELQVERRADGPIRSQVAKNAKAYQQMINNFLQEVPIQSSEWQRNVDTCQGWTIFMTRVFDANVEGRRAELMMQKDRGHINDEELNSGLLNSWLWVRDLLTNKLKAASKGSHIMQGNSLLALGGLANAVHKYRSSVEHDPGETEASPIRKKGEQYQSSQDWFNAAVDTMLDILDGNLKTIGVPMDWCQQISSATSSASSVLARACAALGMSQVLPALLAEEFDRIQQVVEVLLVRIPGQPKAGSSSVIQAHCSVGMGLVLKQLYQENFRDFFGQEGALLLARGLDALEMAALSPDLQNTEGAIYGLGLAMTSLCKDAALQGRMHAKATYEKMVEFNEKQTSEEDTKSQVRCIAVAYSTISSFDADLLDTDFVIKTALNLEKRIESSPQDRDLASALGLLVHGLKIAGVTAVEELFLKWTNLWQASASDNSLSTSLRVAAVNGLSALHGSEQTLFRVENTAVSAKSYLEDGVKILKQLLRLSPDVTLTANIVWHLGRLWISSKNLIGNQSTLPDNLDYVGEDSVLSCLIHLLIEFGKSGIAVSSETVETLNTTLQVLTEGPHDPLPPLNWTNILVPLVKHSFGSKTTQLCLDLALRSTSPTATAAFLPSWLSPSVLMTLGIDCKIRLYSSLDRLVRVLPTKKSKEFFENATKIFSEKQIDAELAEAALDGLCSVLSMDDPPKSIVSHAKETVGNIYRLLPNNLELEHERLISKLGACLRHFSAEDVERLTEPKKENLVKSIAMRKQLIIQNQQFSCKLVKPCVDLALSTGIIFDVLPHLVSVISSMKDVKNIIAEWIIQLLTCLGQTENSSETKNAILVVLTVLSLTTNNKEDVTSAVLVLTHQDSLIGGTSSRDSFHESLFSIRNLLPETLSSLLEKPEYKIPVEKVIDKMLCLYQSSCDSEASRLILENLLELRRFDVYQKRPVWTQVASCV